MTPKSNDSKDFSTTHDLKTWPESFDAIESGKKNHEFRFDDRDFKVGDFLRLKRWDPKEKIYTGRELVVRITYCHRLEVYSAWLAGYCTMSIERIKK